MFCAVLDPWRCSEDDEVPSGSLLPKKQRKPQQDDDSRAAKRQKRAAAVAADSSDEDEEDRGDAGAGSGSEGSQEDADVAVKPYELSDDDGDDEQGGYAAPDFDSSGKHLQGWAGRMKSVFCTRASKGAWRAELLAMCCKKPFYLPISVACYPRRGR